MGVRRNFSGMGQSRHFAYRFQLVDDATQTDSHKTRHPFYTTKKMPNITATVAYSVIALKKFNTKKMFVLVSMDISRLICRVLNEWNKYKILSKYEQNTFNSCSFPCFRVFPLFWVFTSARDEISRVVHGTYLSVPFPSSSNLCLSHLIPSHETFPMGFP